MNANIMKVAVVVVDDKGRRHVDAVGGGDGRDRHGDGVEGIVDDGVGRRHDDADDGGDDDGRHAGVGGCPRRR